MPSDLPASPSLLGLDLDAPVHTAPSPAQVGLPAGRGNALIQAEADRRQAGENLQALFDQASVSGTGFWHARMPGHAISRLAHARQLLHGHWSSSVSLHYGLGEVDARTYDSVELEPTGRYARLRWQAPEQPGVTSQAVLLVVPAEAGESWLLYWPQDAVAIRAFGDLPTLQHWALARRRTLWPSVPGIELEADSARVQVQPLTGDGIETLLRSLLPTPDTAQPRVQWQLPSALSERLAALVEMDEQLAEEEIHFDALDSRLPLGWCRRRIDRQEQLLNAYLGGNGDPASAAMERLRAQQAKLDAQDAALQAMLAAMPEPFTAQSWSELQGESSRFEHLSTYLADNLLQEAEFQHLLGDLPAPHLHWVRTLVDRPEPSLQRGVVASALAVGVPGRTWKLTGLLMVQAASAQAIEPGDATVLLYKPGHDGGLLSFESEEQLFERLLATLQGAWPEALIDSLWPQDGAALIEHLARPGDSPKLRRVPILNHAFDYLAQTQLALLGEASLAIGTQWRWKIAISGNAARLQAFERLAERNRTDRLQTLLSPLAILDNAQRERLAKAFDDLRKAMRASDALIARDLPERGRFARSRLHEHLGKTYGLTRVSDIRLDIADRTVVTQVPLPESGFGQAYKQTITFSAERSEIPLQTFLLWALDDDLSQRLSDARVIFDDATLAADLQSHLDPPAIAQLSGTLDLAGAYEQTIIDAFKGAAEQTQWQAQWRQEVLRAPYECALKILTLSHPRSLDARGQAVLERFCQEQCTGCNAPSVRHHDLDLRPGTALDGTSHRVALSGIFLVEPDNGPVLLLMPDAPNGKVVTQHDDRQAACRSLEFMALDAPMRDYLAALPIDGEYDKHRSYIDQALLEQFCGFIEVGIARSESVAEVQARLLMGRLVMEHRASSRSKADLYMEREAIRHGRVYDYIKLALGFLPGVGALVALYDGWHAANASVEAFLRNDPAEGIAHLNSVFLSLADAAFDLGTALLPGSVHTPAHARTLARQSQLAPRPPVLTRRTRPQPFAGYASQSPSGRWKDHPEVHGRGVYRHVESNADYILHQGQHYSVEWDPTYRTWRLSGNALRTYKQPIRLNAQGAWESHGRVSGHLVDNGLGGGGAYLGRLYQRGWENLRAYLGRPPALLSPEDLLLEIDQGRLSAQSRLIASQEALRTLVANQVPGSPLSDAVRHARNAYGDQLQDFVNLHEQGLERLRGIRALAGNPQRRLRDGLAYNIAHQHPALIRLRHMQLFAHYEDVLRVQASIEAGPVDLLAQMKALRAQQRLLTQALGQMERELHRAAALKNRLQGANLTTYTLNLDALDLPLDPNSYRVVRLSIEAANVLQLPSALSGDLLLALRQVNRELTPLRSQLFSHQDLASAGLSRAQEHRFLLQVRARYQRFDSFLLSWQDDFPEFVTAQSTRPLRQELARLIEEVEQALAASAPVRRPPAVRHGPQRPRLFETVDQQLLIGREVSVDGEPRMVVSSGLPQEPGAMFTRSMDNRWQASTSAPAAPSGTLSSLLISAGKRLDEVPRQRANLQRYQQMNMAPASLQDLADGYATTLEDLARSVLREGADTLSPVQRALVQQVQRAASDLRLLGKRLRIDQIKALSEPTAAHLEYLHGEDQVRIRWSRVLEPAKNKHGQPSEYLEEYRIDDAGTGQALWYAHFHFRKRPASGFTRLEAGHLKLASQRNQRADAWRGVIDERQATALFGGLRPAVD
ncbi:hypothetical protein IAE35_22380 [Pseudomonas sp. S75]|uniref:hypothetical protein n=1 Tax=unclassified Pseudomonas TaxID=196821 RepID=UPI00190790B9|nr:MULTISPECIES: hypothetical protein [unclassified Pseudomonas]MBJ9978215.1 hypothetical protein [Pseudomonas sp. S30]MBK0156097.1 hypothetical protein [Pseudomonas sp. S75]